MGLHFHRNDDGTTTGRNDANGFTVTHAEEEEVKRQLYEDAGWEYTPRRPRSRRDTIASVWCTRRTWAAVWRRSPTRG